jgi:hypothetical protein
MTHAHFPPFGKTPTVGPVAPLQAFGGTPVDKLEPDYEALRLRGVSAFPYPSHKAPTEEGLEPDYDASPRRAPAKTLLSHLRSKAEVRAEEDIEVAPLPIEEEANRLVFGDRQAAYGHPSSDFTATGRMVAAILSRWLESEEYLYFGNGPIRLPDIPPRVVALMMAAVKLSRESAKPSRDNRVDLIGYVLCEDRIVSVDHDALRGDPRGR